MNYATPMLRELGSFSSLTLGNNGSCPDGNAPADQRGGGVVGGPGLTSCGVSGSTGNTGNTNNPN